MGIFDGRLDLLLLFIAQVVQIVLSILTYIRLSQMMESRRTKSKTRSRAMHSSMDGMVNGLKFSRMLRSKRRAQN